MTMKRRALFLPRTLQAFTLTEMMVSLGASLVIMAVMVSSSIAIQRSIVATDGYIRSVNNGNRLVDYVAQDLRRAVRVGTLVNGTASTLKNNASFTVSETNILTINVPDYYASNTPDNAAGSSYKTRRYDRSKLNTATAYNSDSAGSPLNGCVPWDEAITTVGSKPAVRFAPTSAGNGEIQIRYFRGPRSTKDATVCFFRAEYPANSNTPFYPPREIAERTGDTATSLTLTAPNLPVSDAAGYGRTFTVESSFTPRYRRSNVSTAGTAQYVKVTLRNRRRD